MRQGDLFQAALRPGVPAQGQRLVCHRLQGRGQACCEIRWRNRGQAGSQTGSQTDGRGRVMKRYFITGLLLWVPLGITFWVLSLLIGTMDQTLLLLPESIRPRAIFGFNIPGFGVILTLLVVFMTGFLTANIIGQRLLMFWEGLLSRIPVVKSIYYS